MKKLDRNGYAESILQYEDHCLLCYSTLHLQRHEVFHGPNRDKSKRYGLWVKLCPTCHLSRVHNGDGKIDRQLKKNAQEAAMLHYGWSVDEFRAIFGKSWI
jgi:Zn-finger protein